MVNEMTKEFLCPKCGSTLAMSDLNCTKCGFTGRIDDDLMDLTIHPDYYYGEIDQKIMNKLVSDSKSHGWKKALFDMTDPMGQSKAKYHRRYALNEQRAGWKFLLPESCLDGVVLDLGCGWGATSTSLARTVGHVVSMDMTAERLKFLRCRNNESGVNNVTYLRAGDGDFLPFPTGTFDAIAINGVLEWVPSAKEGNPRDIQIKFLHEVKRVLKKDGVLYLALENRTAAKYFLGEVEDHTGIRFLSLMPRFLADIVSYVKQRQGYRNYTYTKWGLDKLLSDAGFSSTTTYSPSPDYRDFDQLISLDTHKSIKLEGVFQNCFSRKHKLYSTMMQSKFKSVFSLAFGAFTSNSSFKSITERLLEGFTEDKPHDESIVIYGYFISGQGSAILSVVMNNVHHILRLPIDSEGVMNSERNHSNLNKVALSPISKEFLKLIPWSVSKRFNKQVSCYLEQKMPGVSAVTLLSQANAAVKVELNAVRFLNQLTGVDITSRLHSSESIELYVTRIIGKISSCYFVDSQAKSFLSEVSNFLVEALSAHSIPQVLQHGDFWSGNFIVDEKTLELTGLIDWAEAEFDGMPGVDICQMLIEDAVVSGKSYYEVVRNVLSGEFIQSGSWKCVMDEYSKVFPEVKTYFTDIFILSWLFCVSRRVESFDEKLLDELFSIQFTSVYPLVHSHIHDDGQVGK